MKPVTKDQPLMRDHYSSNLALHFYTFVPVMKDDLFYKTTFCGVISYHKFHCTPILHMEFYMCKILYKCEPVMRAIWSFMDLRQEY